MASTNSNITGVPVFYYLDAKKDAGAGGGILDDTVPLQFMLDNAIAGQTVVFTTGTYLISRVNPDTTDYCLNLPKSVNVIIELGAVIKLIDGEITNGTDEVYMFEINSSNIVIQGDGMITMNRAGQTDTTIGTNIGTRICINANGTAFDNIRISDITIEDAMGDGIRLKGLNNTSGVLTNVRVRDITMNNCREGVLFHWANNIKCRDNTLIMDNSTGAQDGFETSECDDAIFTGNYVEGAKGSGYDLFFAGERLICNSNTAKACGSGIAIGNNTGAGGTGKDISVVGNIISGTVTTFGIGVYLTTGADRVIIAENIIYDTKLQHAIDVSAGSGISVIHNTIDTAAIGNGIFIRAGVDNTVVSDNPISNMTGGSGIGIRIDADNCGLNDNKIITTGSDGIELNGDNNKLDGNDLSGEIIDDNGTSNIKINNTVTTSGLNNAGATTPIDHNNVIGGTWTT